MARTWAQANTERLRLLALGRRLSVKMVKSPIMGNDGAIWPGNDTTNDWMLLIKDPRPTGTSVGAAASLKNQGVHFTIQGSRSLTRWYGQAQEHSTRLGGPILGRPDNAIVGPWVGWKLYGAGEVREGGAIPNSAVTYA